MTDLSRSVKTNFQLTYVCSWAYLETWLWSLWMAVTASKTLWPTMSWHTPFPGPRSKRQMATPNLYVMAPVLPATCAPSHSAYNGYSIVTWNVTAISSAICALSVARASTTPLTWSGTHELTQVRTKTRTESLVTTISFDTTVWSYINSSGLV